MKLAIICGLASERAALGDMEDTVIGVSGARPEKAEADAAAFARDGADILVSFGLAGGLSPALQPGTLVLPDAVCDEHGRVWPCDRQGHARIMARTHVAGGRLLGVETIIESAARKAALHAASGAVAVDMESHRVAKVAAAAGVPFLALRAIGDPFDRALPKTALNAVDAKGQVRLLVTLFGVMRRPQDVPALLALGRDSKAGHDALRTAGRALADYSAE